MRVSRYVVPKERTSAIQEAMPATADVPRPATPMTSRTTHAALATEPRASAPRRQGMPSAGCGSVVITGHPRGVPCALSRKGATGGVGDWSTMNTLPDDETPDEITAAAGDGWSE